jgi:hypothetical protein
MSRKDLLLDIAASETITITTAAGRSYTARVRKHKASDLEVHPPVELLSLELGGIEAVPASIPSRAAIEKLLLDACPALASAPPRLRAHLERHAGAIAQLVDAAGEAPAEADIRPPSGGRVAV